MKMVLLTPLNHFDIEFVCTANGSEPAERLMFAMAPVGFRMRLSCRAPERWATAITTAHRSASTAV